MARNGSGTYTLPNSAVVAGTAITVADENSTRNDIATELTDSVSRSNKGAMLAALSLHDGASATVPDLTYSGDTDTGIGHSAANTLDMIAGGTAQVILTASAATLVPNTTVSGTLTSTGALTASSTANVVGNFSVATSKFTVTASSGDTTVAGALAVTGALTAPQVAKAWATLTCGNAGAVTVTKGSGIASASYTGSNLTINFTTTQADTSYAVTGMIDAAGTWCVRNTASCTTAHAVITKYGVSAGSAIATNLANGDVVSVVFYD